MLTQPMPEAWLEEELVHSNEWNAYFEASHAEFLQAGGARVIPLDYRLEWDQMKKLLAQINGVYIPGDTKDAFQDGEFVTKVRKILNWTYTHNLDDSKHFPVMGVSYGMLSMLRSQLRNYGPFEEMPLNHVHEALQHNLCQMPLETYVYDEIEGKKLEKLFDHIDFYNEVDVGIRYGKFDFI